MGELNFIPQTFKTTSVSVYEDVLGRQFNNERALEKKLEEINASDKRIVLDKDKFAIEKEMPSTYHQYVLKKIQKQLELYCDGCSIDLSDIIQIPLEESYSGDYKNYRYPDIS